MSAFGLDFGDFMAGAKAQTDAADKAAKTQSVLDAQQKQTDALNAASAAWKTAQAQAGGGTPATPGTSTTPPSNAVTTTPLAPAQGASPTALASADPVAPGLAPYQKAFLNTLAGGESGGKYNIRYDGTPTGAPIADLSQHPNVLVPTSGGQKSSAAGRYMFTGSTWNDTGGGDFSPANQDTRAWALAADRYKQNTGGDLATDLQKGGMTPGIMNALGSTWTSLNTNRPQRISDYNASMARYGAQPAVTPAAAPAQPPAFGSVLPAQSLLYSPSGAA
jgi:muramidase (phage lysozyme)